MRGMQTNTTKDKTPCYDLSNKVVLVTGASSGIGKATAELFAQQGAKVGLTGRREEELYQLEQSITAHGGQCMVLCGDITSEPFVQRLIATIQDKWDHLDMCINNVGILGELTFLQDMSLDNWNKVIQTNLTSAFLCAKYQIQAMKKHGGSILFTSSFVGNSVGFPQMTAYSASKAGLIGLSKSLAIETAELGIRVNTLLPGGTDTPMGQSVANTPESRSYIENLHLLKRMASPQEIAKAALFLSSDAASFITGTQLFADGGISIYRA